MVVLTVVFASNGFTIYLNKPLPKPNYVRLILCSPYNSCHNLKLGGEIKFSDKHEKMISFTQGVV